jgi:hypothetical protein
MGHTLSVDPQQGTGFFPVFKDAALSEPYRGAFIMSIARNVVVYR